ncbi:MAG: ABC transporter permease [Chloroflexota bacterium]|nr:ABC transporter permease [Chloroflexota bacterium]
MSIKRLTSILAKEYRHIIREPRTLWMVFLSPAFVLIALSLVFTSGSTRINLGIWDQDLTVVSRRFIGTLSSDPDFTISYVSDDEEIESRLMSQRIHAAVIIPPGFADTVQDGNTASVQVILDGVDTVVARNATGSLRASAAAFGARLSEQTVAAASPVEIRPQSAYLPTTADRDSMVSGLIPIVFSLPVIAAALALAREREKGTLETLVASPVRGLEYLGGKLFAYVTASLTGLLPVWLTASLLFGVPFRGSPLLLVVLTADFLLASVGLATVVGNLVHSQQAATVLSLFIFFVPAFFLSGLTDPIDVTDVASIIVSYVMPSTHFVTICRGLFLKGASLAELWRPSLMLLGLSAVWMALGALTFKKRIA